MIVMVAVVVATVAADSVLMVVAGEKEDLVVHFHFDKGGFETVNFRAIFSVRNLWNR